jgi:galactonate dehydratase
MKISGVELTTFVEHHRRAQVLVLRSDAALSGIGEVAASGGGNQIAASTVALADLLVGRDPFDVEALLSDAKGDADGTIVDFALVSAATSAMLDLAARSLDIPVHQLLGGGVRDRIRACAVGWAEGAAGPQELASAARRTVASGFTALRVEPFATSLSKPATNVATATELVRAVRHTVPDEVDLVVAADRRLTVSSALELADALRPLEPMWLEEPVPASPIDPLRRISQTGALPLAAGRGARPDVLRDLVTGNLVDHLAVEVGRVGGLIEARRIAALAEVYHVGVVPVGSGGSVSLGAALDLAAAVPNLSMVEVRPGLAAVEDGTVSVSDRPRVAAAPAGVSEVSS